MTRRIAQLAVTLTVTAGLTLAVALVHQLEPVVLLGMVGLAIFLVRRGVQPRG